MAQLQSPETYADGQQVTAARLNNQTNGALLLPGAINDQSALPANTVAAGDQVILHDISTTTLSKATAGDLLNSGLPVTTSTITGSAGVDVVINPAAGQKVDVAGNLEADDINVTDDLTVGDNATISGNLLVTGSSTLTGNVITDNGFNSNGVANFTGTFQMGGTVGFALTEIVEETIPYVTLALSGTTWTDLFTSAVYTKPAGEVWVIDAVVQIKYEESAEVGVELIRTSDISNLDLLVGRYSFVGSPYLNYVKERLSFVYDSASTFTSTFKLRGTGTHGFSIYFSQTGSVNLGVATHPVYKFRIYKYKTA